MTHEILIFVKILFNFKKKNSSSTKEKPENPFKIAKNLNCLYTCYFKNFISPKLMAHSMKSNSIEKFKAIESIAHALPIFQIF